MDIQEAKKTAVTMTAEEYEQHNEEGDGICLGCKEIQYGGVEPDARGYPCDACNEPRLCGVEQALLMGAVVLEGE